MFYFNTVVYILHHETPVLLKLVVGLATKPSTLSHELLATLCTRKLDPGVAEYVGKVEDVYIYMYKFNEHKSCSQTEQYSTCKTISTTPYWNIGICFKICTKVWIIFFLSWKMANLKVIGNEIPLSPFLSCVPTCSEALRTDTLCHLMRSDMKQYKFLRYSAPGFTLPYTKFTGGPDILLQMY